MAKKYMPFPIDLTQYEEVESLTPLQFGILMRFIQRYWKTGIDLPDNEYQLYHNARCPYSQWALARAKVYQAMKACMNDIAIARKTKIAIKQKLSQNAVIARTALRITRKPKNTMLSDREDTHVEIIPVQIPRERWNPGTYDHVERDKALKSNDSGKEKLLYDK